jgi:hypothetical protein
VTKTGNIIFLFILFFLVHPAFATISVQASVDTTDTTLDQPVTLTVSVISDENVNIEPPRLADINGFRLDGSTESTSVNQQLMSTPHGMDWKTQRRKDFHYLLTPMKAGRLTIPGIEVKVNGKTETTQAILINVGQAGQARRQQRPQQNQQGYNWPGGGASLDEIDRLEEEMFNRLLNRAGQGGIPGGPGGVQPRPIGPGGTEPQYRSLPTNPNEAFFVSVEVDKTEVYEGEQVTASWYVYTRGQMESLDRVKFPDLKGFWKEIIEEVPLIQFTDEVINGIPYKKALLASHALFPIKPGTATIDEYKIKSRVRLPGQGYSFGTGRANEYTRSSQRVNIKVKPLPSENRPSDFAGAVGQFEVQTSIEGQKFPVNQPFNLRIRFEGMGNAKMIELPAIKWPDTVELYDTKTESKFFKDGRSYKQFDLLMIPRQQGHLSIPEITFSMFDPVAKKYYQKKTSAIDLDISENTQAPSGNLTRENNAKPAAPEKSTGPQLPSLVPQEDHGSALLAAINNPGTISLGYLILLFGLFVKARGELGWGQRRKSLRDLVEKRFKKVDAALKAGDYRNVGAELMNVFYYLLGEATGQGGAVQEVDRLLDQAPPSVRRELGANIKKSFDQYQILCFAPEELVKSYSNPEKLKTLVKESRDLSGKLISALMSETGEEKS